MKYKNRRLTGLVTSSIASYQRKDKGREVSDKKTRKKLLDNLKDRR
jgi:hypothetical protein